VSRSASWVASLVGGGAGSRDEVHRIRQLAGVKRVTASKVAVLVADVGHDGETASLDACSLARLERDDRGVAIVRGAKRDPLPAADALPLEVAHGHLAEGLAPSRDEEARHPGRS